MKITVSKEIFEKYVPVASSPNMAVFDKMAMFLEEAEVFATTEICGDSLLLHEKLHDALTAFICLRAFAQAIPQIDLVLTANGFAITNTQNLTPASRERVERLIKQCNYSTDLWHDKMLDIIYSDQEMLSSWNDSGMAGKVITSVLWESGQLRSYFGKPNAVRSDVAAMVAETQRVLPDITAAISPEYYAELVEKTRKNSLTSQDKSVVNIILRIFYAATKSQNTKCMLKDLVSFLETCLPDFTTYQNSTTYKARHYESYENDPQSKTYFFT